MRLRINEIKYMRHIISKDGLKPEEEKIRAVKCMERPKKNSKDF